MFRDHRLRLLNPQRSKMRACPCRVVVDDCLQPFKFPPRASSVSAKLVQRHCQIGNRQRVAPFQHTPPLFVCSAKGIFQRDRSLRLCIRPHPIPMSFQDCLELVSDASFRKLQRFPVRIGTWLAKPGSQNVHTKRLCKTHPSSVCDSRGRADDLLVHILGTRIIA